MPLHMTVNAVTYDGMESPVCELYIGRMEDLKKTSGIHTYSISPVFHPWDSRGEFKHEYTDGANICTRKAIAEALPLLPTVIPEEPLQVCINLVGYYSVEREIAKFHINKDAFPKVDMEGKQRYGIYQEVWPFEPIAEFLYADEDGLAGYLVKALETIEGEHHGKE